MIEKDKLVKAIKHPERVLEVILRRFFSMYIDDRTFIKLDYFTGKRKFPILNNWQRIWLKGIFMYVLACLALTGRYTLVN